MVKKLPKPPPPPTEGELRILQVLWRNGPSTVRQVHDVLSRERPATYTTTLKLLQIMHEKGLAGRDVSERTHVYAAAVTEAVAQRQATRDLIGRLFGGSAAALVQNALDAQPASPDELERIREMIRNFERGANND